MSHSNRHQFSPLTKSSKPLTGQRLVRVIAKAAKDGSYHANLSESLCMSVPVLTGDEVRVHIDALMPHIVSMCMDAQDSIVKELRLESGCTEVAEESISVAAIVGWMDTEAKGGRVTGEYLTEWFKDAYALQAAEFIAIACRFGEDADAWTPDQVTVIEQKTNVLAGMFAGFASGKYAPQIPQCRAILKFGEFVSESVDSRMAVYLEKTAKVLKVREEELNADALGF
jgi:hypothetical protein